MTDAEFGDWVAAHVKHTGADPARLTELLWANRLVIIGKWNATYADMCECTDRLFSGGRIPQFPAEHPNALHRELVALRAERARREQSIASITAPGETVKGCDCPRCMPPNGSAKWQAASARLKDWIKRNGSLAGFGMEIPKR